MSEKHPKIADLPEILLQCLSEKDSSFHSAKFLRDLQSLETNLERINITYKSLEQCNLLPVLKPDTKNDAVAKKQWSIGNNLFTETNYLKSLECYTRSICCAQSKEVLAAGYANRSLCLYKMQFFKECITDIDRALAKNYYPADLRPKLLDRRSRAEKQLKPPERFYQDIPKIPSSRRNPAIQCARNCVEIRKNRRFGRHVVATRDIQIGEVICVEKCYAHMPKETRFLHCHHCLELCYNPIPCPGCTATLYCSEDCKNKAKKIYHKYFCPWIRMSLDSNYDPLYLLALKIVILAKKEPQDDDDGEVYRSDRYKEVKELMAPTKEMTAKELLEKTVVTTCVYHMVKNHTDFFTEIEISEDEFKEMLLLQVQIVFLNHLAIYENIQNEKQYDCEMFGVGLYPFTSIFNHSCCPNVDSVQYGSTIVCRATNTIPKGNQLFINYSVQYEGFAVDFRKQFLLFSFYFECKCEACEHNWMMCGDKKTMEPTLTADLKLTETEIHAFSYHLGRGDVNVARQFLQHIIPHFKRIEQDEPFGNAWRMKDLISTCYKTMGNKRRV